METDLESVDYLRRLVSQLGEYLPGKESLERRPETDCLTGKHFAAESRLIPDYERNDGTLSIQIKLRPRGRGKPSDRYLYVRFQNAGLRLDNPKAWRKAVKQLTAANPRRHRKRSWSLELSRDIYWVSEVSREDLKAQILIALIQLDCLPPDSPEVNRCLADYILHTYRIRVDHTTPKSERAQTREAVAFLAVGSIVRRWMFPEDYRAFRFYASTVVRYALREYVDPVIPKTNARQHFTSESNDADRDSSLEPVWDPATGEGLWSSSLLRLWREGRPVLKDQMTVAEASAYLNLSESYIHRLIRQKRLTCVPSMPAITLSMEEVERVQMVVHRRRSMRDKVNDLKAAGKTSDASRRAIYRGNGALPRI